MAGFFDDDSDEEQAVSVPRQTTDRFARPAVPVRAGQGGHASSSRQPSVVSDSSRAYSRDHAGEASGSGSGGRSFLHRLESTVSPRSDRVSESIPRGFETDDMSSMNGTTSHFEYPAAQRRDGAYGYTDSSLRGSEAGDARTGRGRYSRDAADSDAGTVLGRHRGDRDDAMLGAEDEEDLLDADLDDVKRLGKVWVRERGTVDIMQWEGDLMDSLFDKLEQQQKMMDTLRSDPQTSEEEHFKLMLVMTEMERVKYLIRSYVRTRLWKIEKYSHHILVTPILQARLSGAEMAHARRYTELLHTHYQHSVLDSLPEWLRKMDDSYGDGLSMITKPNHNVPVLIYCRRDCGEITLSEGESAALAKGTTHLVKYNLVEQWINLGWAEVL